MAQEYKAKADELAAEVKATDGGNNRSQRFARRRYKRALARLSWRYCPNSEASRPNLNFVVS